MVSSTRTATRLMIVARPNQSATWNANLLLLLLLAIPVLTIAILLALVGAWLVLPFAGMELLALGVALYRVNWKLRYRHIITVSGDSVCIDKGYHTPRQHWQFARANTGLTITTQRHPWDRPELHVHDRHESVTLGEFLNHEDSLQLIDLLQREIRVRAQSANELREF